MTLGELRAEYRTEVIGATILDEVRRACASQARRYPPVVYARSPSWNQDSIEDLVQDVVVERLLGERQLAYLFDVAGHIRDWRALLNRQVKVTLARRRVRTVVDNLLVRSGRHMARADGVESIISSGHKVFRRVGAQEPYRTPTDREARTVAERARIVPRRPPESGERAPAVYSEHGIKTVIEVILHHTPGGVTMRDLGRILELMLTDWVPAVLELDEARDVPLAAVLSPEEIAEVRAIASELLSSMSEEEAEILRGRLAGLPDTEVARWIGVSRPTLTKRQHVLIERIRAASEHLAAHSQERLMDEIALAIAVPAGDRPHD